MSALITFLRSANGQAGELKRRFVAHLMVHRRTQTRVGLVVSMMLTVILVSLPRPGGRAPARTDSPAPCSVPSTTASVPADWRVVALPRDVIAPRMEPGDRVDVVTQAQVIAADAVVVAPPSDTDGLVVAVPPASAAAVATSAQNGDVSVVGHG
ncbi:MAG: hypothetical protein RLZZ526_1862 [Actinomycetota bacterium]